MGPAGEPSTGGLQPGDVGVAPGAVGLSLSGQSRAEKQSRLQGARAWSETETWGKMKTHVRKPSGHSHDPDLTGASPGAGMETFQPQPLWEAGPGPG